MLPLRLSPSNSAEFLLANNLLPRYYTVATNGWYLDPKIENIKEYENDMCIRVEIRKKKKIVDLTNCYSLSHLLAITFTRITLLSNNLQP